ncbi:perlucin-like protein [Mercenaria mercenaria]|uniref:perlucin-like protein n=1 Tax=Mercenaria mercenaria TaxID=6596 RepID=UPI00234E3E35|nr:perlucin-like protein [Mercenaria mercenaria]
MAKQLIVCGIIHMVISILSITGVSADTLCPDSWTAFRGSCYLFAHENLTFMDAERSCVHYGAHLVHVDDATENTFLKSYLSNLKDPIHWIGLTDEVTEGIWVWYDNNEVATFTNWHNITSEPNGGKAQNCVYIAEGHGYEWIDAPCGWKRKPLCEKREQEETIVG